uniref:Uncharacterized protein n=1 Tax=Anopheles atroparvus TaxID=41427 RepID=A0AAG5D8G6_ANOAO
MFSRCRDWVMKKRKKGKFCRWSRCAPSEQASNEFIGMEAAVQMPPEERRQSLPRRLLGRFLSERSINDEAEELKQLMIEHGLYNRHQTLEQRRRLKELLDLEDRSLLADNERRRDDFLLLQSRLSHRNFLKNVAPPCSSTLSSEAALLYW